MICTPTHIKLNININMNLNNHTTALDLLRDADNTMHQTKKLSKNRYKMFDKQTRDKLTLHNELKQALHVTLNHDNLQLHYQLITDTITNIIQNLKALCQ